MLQNKYSIRVSYLCLPAGQNCSKVMHDLHYPLNGCTQERIFLSVCLPVCLSVCMYACMYVYLSVCLCVCVCLYCISVCLSACLCLHLLPFFLPFSFLLVFSPLYFSSSLISEPPLCSPCPSPLSLTQSSLDARPRYLSCLRLSSIRSSDSFSGDRLRSCRRYLWRRPGVPDVPRSPGSPCVVCYRSPARRLGHGSSPSPFIQS